MSVYKKVFQYGGRTVSLETGEIARQTTAAVVADIEGTTVLVNVVAKAEVKAEQNFFPLTVNYQEKTYAAGKIPGGYFKREGRPTERETLVSRLIDRPIRPLFPDGFNNEVQVVVTVMSSNPEVDADIVSMIGASAALVLAGIPFNGPIGAARVGYQDNRFLLNPTPAQLKNSQLDLVVAGTKSAVLMVESEANILPEDVMLEAVWYGHEQMQVVIDAINEFAREAGKPAWNWSASVIDAALEQKVAEIITQDLAAAFQIKDKLERGARIGALKQLLIEKLIPEGATEPSSSAVGQIFEKLAKKIVRTNILDGSARIDGRDTRTVRSLAMRIGVFDRTHGSALFTRGETQALVVTTLGSERDAQSIESLMGEEKDRFLFHYNFPPYCVGETGIIGSPKRREIGHGRLAKRGILAVLPTQTEFPYVIRVVSEITESNGSSSMASICGSSLSLMDAGVPIKAPVAGIAMGLIKEENKFAILTDIMGDEDHLGDMDFKVAGTAEGITALQMDIKIDGITKFIMKRALEQAREGRMHILSAMQTVISEPKKECSRYAPIITTMQINPAKIKDVIGKGGATIRSITESTGATIDISEEGVVTIAAPNQTAGNAACERVEQIVKEVEVGEIYEGKVSKIMDFGAFINLYPGQDGFLHISQIRDERVENIADVLQEGQIVKVKVVEIDRQGRVRLTTKPSEFSEE